MASIAAATNPSTARGIDGFLLRDKPILRTTQGLTMVADSPPIKYRKLRITWSVGCTVACVLLIVLWVRSYWRTTYIVGQISSSLYFQVSQMPGTFGLYTSTETGVAPGTVIHVSSEEWMQGFEEQKAAGGSNSLLCSLVEICVEIVNPFPHPF